MEPLALDAAEYTGTYKLIGGRLCLDFVNTLAWPGHDRGHDWLDPWTNLIDWSVASGLLGEPDADALRRRYGEDHDAVAAASTVLRHRRRVVKDLVAQGAARLSTDLLSTIRTE